MTQKLKMHVKNCIEQCSYNNKCTCKVRVFVFVGVIYYFGVLGWVVDERRLRQYIFR